MVFSASKMVFRITAPNSSILSIQFVFYARQNLLQQVQKYCTKNLFFVLQDLIQVRISLIKLARIFFFFRYAVFYQPMPSESKFDPKSLIWAFSSSSSSLCCNGIIASVNKDAAKQNNRHTHARTHVVIMGPWKQRS